MSRISMPVLASASVLIAMPAIAQEAETSPVKDNRGTFNFVLENDWFGDQDRNYTNGFRLGYLSAPKDAQWVDSALANLFTKEGEEATIRRGFAVGHSVFTPRDISETEFIPDQHPYAGYLYLEATSLIETENAIDQVSIRLGQVGKSAGGEWLQEEFHSLISDDLPLGWENQVGEQFGADLVYDRRYRALANFGNSDYGVDLVPNAGFTLGTLNTNARAGLTARFGNDLKNDYGPPRIRPSLAGAGYFEPDDDFSWYVFGGAEARYVAHDYILDGSLFDDTDTRSIHTERLVHDLQAGLVLQWGRNQISLTYVERSKQFEEQTTPQRFGAIGWSVKL